MRSLIGFAASIGLLFVIVGFAISNPIVENDDFFTTSITEASESILIFENWSDQGTLSNLETDSDKIYASPNNAGNYTIDAREIEGVQSIDIKMLSDLRDGDIEVRLKMWRNQLEGSPDDTIILDINETNYERTLSVVEQR